METLRDLDIVRGMPARVEFRDNAADGSLGDLVVAFSRFNTWYPIESMFEGEFMERTAPGSFKKTIKDNRQSVKVLFNHGHDPSVGNKVLSMPDTLEETDIGPVGTGPLFDTSYNRDLLPGLRAGAYGSSFRFRVVRDEWNDEPEPSDYNPKGLPERTIKEVRLFEFGPVTFPANPDSTAGMRSMTDRYYSHLRAQNPEQYEELVARARSLRTPEGVGGREGRPASEGAAPQDTSAPGDHPEDNGDATRAAAAAARHRALLLAGVIHA